MRTLIRLLPIWLLTWSAVAQQPLPLSESVLEPAGTGGLRVVDRALARLSHHRRLLIVGAHPDDEDTTLLTLMGTIAGGEAAYLSLSRGEGGQNLIGPELGVGLGVIRTGELLAARQLEGTRQYFTRAFDFGYTRSLEETLERWPRSILEEDAVRIVRRFKPQIIVAIFPADSNAGHGQHQAAGVVAQSIFELSGEPDRFPQLTAAGLPPWQPVALYRRLWRDRTGASAEIGLAAIDPLTGKSVRQIAAASRSMHRSQDMGTLQQLGDYRGGLIRVAGPATPQAEDLFAGIDTGLGAIADLLEPGPLQSEVRRELEWVAALASRTRSNLSPSRLADAVPQLSAIVDSMHGVEARIGTASQDPRRRRVTDLVAEKRTVAGIGLLAAAGVAIDALAERETVSAEESLPVEVVLWDSDGREVKVDRVDLRAPPSWTVRRADLDSGEESNERLQKWRFVVVPPASAPATIPYYLERPLDGDLYDWDGVEPEVMGEPLRRGPLTAVLEVEVSGAVVQVEREVVFRERDQVFGELRRPLRLVPEIEVRVHPDLMLWPTRGDSRRQIEVLVQSHREAATNGELHLRWGRDRVSLSEALPFSIPDAHGQQVLRIDLDRPAVTGSERIDLILEAVAEDEQRYAAAYPVVSYPHVRPQALPQPARVELQSIDLELPELDHVGYVRGASDRVPEVLSDLGVPVQLILSEDLATMDLSAFDVIVIGSRAYETDPRLAAVNARLLEYVRSGGRLLVQYQQYQFANGGYAPYRIDFGRPHGRVTEEGAPVRVLVDQFGILSGPNQIGQADWQGWVQERGLYFAADWGAEFTPLVEMGDAGQPTERGALLVAEVGDGLYVYTGLSFFRQLPAGVPGAIRLFVNLLSMGRS